jgi:hypothetical protein
VFYTLIPLNWPGHGNSFEGLGSVSSTLAAVPVQSSYGDYIHYSPNETLLAYVDQPIGQRTSLPRKIDIAIRLAEDDSIAKFASNSDVALSLLLVFEPQRMIFYL